ncbi:MAG: lipoprotein NlpI [Methanomassiliicoccales archaeon PtaU1.Bin124]|nr:MAG: lipoprotein NlpI [Methanomassiliicoccales archaeon PtaU1.Bin124]
MSDLSRILDERMDDRIIAAINDLDFKQFQDLMGNLLVHIGVKETSREEEGDSILFRGEGEEGVFLVLASRMFDHASLSAMRRLRSLATAEGRNPVLLITTDLSHEGRTFAEKEGISYADKPKILLLLRKYELSDSLMQDIDKKILEQDGKRVLPSAGKFDHHMQTAMEHMDKGRFKDALYSLDRALEIKPDHEEVWQAKANALFNLGRLDEALEACQKATSLRPRDHSSWYLLGLIEGQMGNYEGEVKAYDNVLKLQPNNRSAMLNKGTALYRLRKMDQALKVYDQMLKFYPNDAMAYNNRGIVLKAMQRWAEALDSFAKAISLDRSYVNPIINTGLIHSEAGQHVQAIDDWKRALQIERRRPELWLSLGLSQRATGDLESALDSFDKALDLDPGLEEARRQQMEIMAILAPPMPQAESAPEAATEVSLEGPEVPPEEVRPLPVEVGTAPLAPAIEAEKQIQVSEGSAKEIVPMAEAGPLVEVPQAKAELQVVKTGESRIAVAEVPGAMQAVPEERTALAEVQNVIAEAIEPPMDPHERHVRTITLMLLVGEADQAVREAEIALAEEPDAPDLIRLKAKALTSAGRMDAALPVLTDIFLREKDEYALYDIEALSYRFNQKAEGRRLLSGISPSRESVARDLCYSLESSQWDDAITKARNAGPNASAISRASQALALMMKGRYREASKFWKEVLEDHPGSAEALNNLGVCMRFMGEYGYEEPIHYMVMATMVDPGYADAWNNVGCVYFAAGAYDESLKAFKNAIALDRRPDYYLNLTSVLMALNEIDAAKDALTSALKLEESAEVLFMLAVIAEREGDMKWALKLYDDTLALKPDFKDAVFNRQRVKLFLKYNK